MSWPSVPLSKCCDIVSGSTPRREVAAYWDGHIPWVTPKDISELNGAKILEDAPEYITEAGYKACSTRMLPQGSILFSSRAPIGLVAVAGREMCTNQGFKSLVPHENVDSDYLYHCMKWMAHKIAEMGNGATFKEVSKSTMDRIEIPLPPLDEQKRIAGILDKADAIRRKRAESLKLLDELLRATFLDMFGDPITNPKGWPIVPMDSLIPEEDKINYGVVQPGDNVDQGVPIVRVGDFNGLKIDKENLKKISPEIEKKYPKSRIKGNEILIACVGSIGKIAIADDSLKGFNIVRAVARVPVGKLVHREFLASYLLLPSAQNYFTKETRTVSQPTLNISQIAETPVYLPPIDLQAEFVKAAKKVINLELNILKNQSESDTLFHSLVARAFKGEL